MKPKQGNRDGKTIHYSVGAVIRKNGKYLLIDRNSPPFGFAGIAGHVDEGEEPQQSLRKEIKEESGFELDKYKKLFEEFVGWNWCNKGTTGHYWYLFECAVSGEIKKNYRETKSITWYTKEEIGGLKLEPVWEQWFRKLKVI